MNPAFTTWHRRHKRLSRRAWREVRLFLPLLGVFFCFGSSATVIVASESIPHPNAPSTNAPIEELVPGAEPILPETAYSMISINSTSNASAAPAGMRPVARFP